MSEWTDAVIANPAFTGHMDYVNVYAALLMGGFVANGIWALCSAEV